MKLKIEIELDNDAFADDPITEIQYILEDMAARLPLPMRETNGDLMLSDSNGNTVGKAKVVS